LVQLPGVAGKEEMMIQRVIPAMQKQNHWFLPPTIVAWIQAATDNIVHSVRGGARTGKMEVCRAGELDGGGLHFGRGEIEVLQQTLGFLQVQVPPVGFRHAGRGMANGHAVNPLAKERDHRAPPKFLCVVFNAFSFYHKQLI
jgi:hypothetical protein